MSAIRAEQEPSTCKPEITAGKYMGTGRQCVIMMMMAMIAMMMMIMIINAHSSQKQPDNFKEILQVKAKFEK